MAAFYVSPTRRIASHALGGSLALSALLAGCSLWSLSPHKDAPVKPPPAAPTQASPAAAPLPAAASPAAPTVTGTPPVPPPEPAPASPPVQLPSPSGATSAKAKAATVVSTPRAAKAASPTPAMASAGTRVASGAPAATAATAAPAPTTAASAAAAKPGAPAAPPLDLAALEQRLKDTKAIGVFTKLSLKNQVDDLLDDFRNFHKGPGKTPPQTLRTQFDLLMIKVLTLLQDGDPQLAASISSSRESLWDILKDPDKFAKI